MGKHRGTSLETPSRARASSCQEVGTTWFFSSCSAGAQRDGGPQWWTHKPPPLPCQPVRALGNVWGRGPLASRVAQGVSGPSSSCVWNPRVFADDARGWQCPFVLCGVAKSRTRLSAFTFTFMCWRRKWQPTPVFLPGESQGRGSLVGCRLWRRRAKTTILQYNI